MKALAIVSAIVSVLAILLSVWYLGRWIISKSESKPRFRKRSCLSSYVSILAIVSTGIFIIQQNKKEALEAGFESTDAYQAAKSENVTDPKVWAAILAERQAEADARAENARKAMEAEMRATAEAKAVAAEKQRLAGEAECKREISCWGEKAHTVATFLCPRFVARMARYDYEWTDGLLDMKFSRYRWKNIEDGIVTVIGDKIKFQNGFGAWSNMIYKCDVDPSTEDVLDVRVSEGRL